MTQHDDDVFVFPVSFAQRRLWLLDRLDPGNAAYNIPAVVRFRGPLDVDALERGLNAVVARHETLRTNIVVLDQQPMQAVAPQRPIALRRVDLPGASIEAVAGRIEAETLQPFDLAADPLIRASVYRLAADDHVVQLTIHHIVSDGWSMSVLVREISDAYGVCIRGEVPEFPELPIQYGDFAEWQREWLTGDVLERQLSYWRKQLTPAPPVLELPIDRLRPPVQTYRGASVRFGVDAETTAALARLARVESGTLFMPLVAAFKALLFRYTGQDQIAVGTPIANRGRRELEPLIGFFVNTLVLRSRLESRESFRSLLARVRETTLDAYAHQDVPFEHLVEALQPERSLSHTPLFQVLFALQNTPAIPAAVAGAIVEPLELEASAAKFDLSVSLTEVDGGLRGAAEYNVDLFDRSTIERLMAHYQTMLREVARDADQEIGRVRLLADPAAERLWNRTAATFAGPPTVHEAFEAQAAATPEAPALRFERESIAYGELNRRANRLAHALRGRGVGPEAIVGVALERSIDLVVSLLAVMKAGGAYLPLDPGYPPERLAMMLADAGARHVVTTTALVEALRVDPGIALCLDEPAAALALQPETNPAADVAPANAAYVIFTSGSTGRPKGAVNQHAAVLNRVRWVGPSLGLTPNDRVLQKTPFSFDVSVWEFFAPLVAGACLVVAKPDGHRDPVYLADLVDDEGVTIVHFVPSMLRAFLDARRRSRNPSLRHVVCSGEALPADVRDAFFAGCDAELWNLYGPTEAAVDVTWWHCARDDRRAMVPIGLPIANAAIHIVDDALDAVPVGVAGELVIGGLPVGRGYVNRPDLTAGRFVPDPFGEPGARLYRTGDRARRLADGSIEFLGRLDFQIKIRGFRVEAGEIEARLRDRLEVADALVVAREERAGDVRLVAYVVGIPGATVDASALREHLAGVLPSYMVPAQFVVLPALPLLPNGKIDRQALPAPAPPEPPAATGAGPRTSTEEIVAAIWRELLGVASVGTTDNFFTLGGHSLLATQVVSRITEVFGVELPLRVVFEQPTIAALSATVDDRRRASAGLVAPPIARAPRDRPLRLSFAQQRLWFLNRIEGTSAAYNMPAALRIAGRVDAATLERTLQELVRRHEVLRARFPTIDGGPMMVIDDEPRIRLAVEDLRGLPSADREAAVAVRAAHEFDLPFDLEAGPLVRARLLLTGDDEQVLLLTTHHIASDGWSTSLLIDDFVRLYAAFADGRPSPLEPLAVQYADFAAWQREWLAGSLLEAQLAYWKRQLAGAPAVSQLPTDRPRPAVQTFNGDSCTFRLGAEMASAVKRLNERAGSTTFITMLAAFFVLLARWTRQQDLVVGSPSAGRSRKELEPVVGFFLNLLVLRGDLGGDPTFRQLVDRVRQVTLDAYAHQDVPFEQVVDAVETARSTSVTPLFQIVFSAAMPDSAAMTLPGLRVEPLPPAKVAAKFELTVGIGEFDGDITGAFEYNADLFDRDTIARMVADYRAIVAAAMAAPDARISALLRPSAGETAQLVAIGAGAAASGADRCVVDRIAARAASAADKVAVRDGAIALSWRELERRATSLGRRMAEEGIGRGDRVAILLPRSADAVVASLAAMTCGAAYVPLDPSYPADRLRFMVGDSGAKLIVARGDERPAGVRVLAPDAEAAGAGRLDVPIDPEDLAYVIYTSGSTGRPKGVEIAHRALMNLVAWHLDAFGVTDRDRMSQVASLAFDASVWETWPALVAGAELHVPDEGTVRSPAALADWIKRSGITIAFVPTPLAEQMLGADWRGAALRTLLTGGDRLHRGAPAGLPCVLVNNYGPTENAVVATSGRVDRAQTLPSIGRPIAGTHVYLVDETLDLVPPGVPGELLIGGASLARGYHGQPALTAERFVPDPFQAGARAYRTGDLARWRSDGALEFLGRVDRQVKLRGFRIEPGEIESVLASHPAVSEAAVAVRGDGADAALVAYVVGREPIAPEALRAHARVRLPEYMVPSAVVALDRLPLTGSGKVDLRALPAPPRQTRRSIEYAVPGTATERLVARIWGDVLAVDEVGVHDNFFDVGGHSLKLVEVHERLQRETGRTLSIVELFQFPTVAALAARLDETAGGAPPEDDVVVAAAERAAKQRAARKPRSLDSV